jgi:hypothetical protein
VNQGEIRIASYCMGSVSTARRETGSRGKNGLDSAGSQSDLTAASGGLG